MNNRLLLGVILILIGLLGITVLIPFYTIGSSRDGFGSIMGPSMMGDWYGSRYSQEPVVTMDRAEVLAKQYLYSLNNDDLVIKEIMEFENNFYIIFSEESTGKGAFEMLIWKKEASSMMNGYYGGMMGQGMMVGTLMPEPGPNMMWNTKYGGMMDNMGGMMGGYGYGGMMGGGMMDRRGGDQTQTTGDMSISEGEARQIGQQYLDEFFPGATIVESTEFYGYYTFDFEKDERIYGMFSINGYTGQAWYHGWHGLFLDMREYGEEHED
jgi:hypothetical protein